MYVVWDGGSGGPVYDFFNAGCDPPTGRDIWVGDRRVQCRSNV